MLTGAARRARPLIYVPNSGSNTVDVINPATRRVIRQFPVGVEPQHVVPSWDLKRLYVTNDQSNTLTPINPVTGRPGRPIPVADPYNLYFTPDGTRAIVVAERLGRLDFRDPHTFRLIHSLQVPCAGVDHIDFSAGGRYLLATCEFSGQILKVDVKRERVIGTLQLPDGAGGMPQDIKLAPNGKLFYVADMMANGLWKIDGRRFKVTGFIHTGAGVHGLYPSRNARYLYATNRGEGSISVISFRTGRVVKKWWIPGGGSPDMGGVSANGRVLWVSGRYNDVVYAISTAQRAAAGEDPGRRQPARPLRVATAGPLLARPHRHPALTVFRRRSGRCVQDAAHAHTHSNPHRRRDRRASARDRLRQLRLRVVAASGDTGTRFLGAGVEPAGIIVGCRRARRRGTIRRGRRHPG